MIFNLTIQSWHNSWKAHRNIEESGNIPTRKFVAIICFPVKRASISTVLQERKYRYIKIGTMTETFQNNQ